ncbi:alpha/beta hydrolase [Gephyromycinifex aptenodytis]|uniref:alpha/beta hydrolase n=1 Tax=Gephyromycinifex aptenodytis TaxID=2716227 RepID=UPI00144763DD|nr:alpha/beta fold hydrolase [Gephyromycinifex aptenodytis]
MGARRDLRKAALVAAIAGGAIGLAGSAGSIGAGVYFARVLLTPECHRPDNTVLLAVHTDRVLLRLDAETRVPGRYGLWLDQGREHIRVGQILAIDERAGTVERELLGIDFGVPAPGPGRWSGHYYPNRPDVSLQLPTYEVGIYGELGELPSWVIPGAGTAAGPQPPRGGRWAVLVHGRGATREECLRAVPVLHRLGITCLIPSYRNDGTAPPSTDGLYGLGLTEWRDIDAALRYALEAGANDLTLFGWSMGGGIVLQTLARSQVATSVDRVVLDAPVIDWSRVIEHHARLRHIPPGLGTIVQMLLRARWSYGLIGAGEPIDIASTRWQHRARELAHPILLIHSCDDDFVPVGPSLELAVARPDLVRFEAWQHARHVKEWNVDPQRWEEVVADFVGSPGRVASVLALRRGDG